MFLVLMMVKDFTSFLFAELMPMVAIKVCTDIDFGVCFGYMSGVMAVIYTYCLFKLLRFLYLVLLVYENEKLVFEREFVMRQLFPRRFASAVPSSQ